MEAHSSVAATIGALLQFWLAPILALFVSSFYFVAAPKSQPLWLRLLAASHGLLIAVIYIGAMTLAWTNSSKPSYGTPFMLLLLLPVALAIASASLFKGKQSVHWLQLVNLLALAWTFFIGIMVVTGDWL
jgi:hypothetical protein